MYCRDIKLWNTHVAKDDEITSILDKGPLEYNLRYVNSYLN